MKFQSFDEYSLRPNNLSILTFFLPNSFHSTDNYDNFVLLFCDLVLDDSVSICIIVARLFWSEGMSGVFAYIQGKSLWDVEARLQGQIDVPLAQGQVLSVENDCGQIKDRGINVIYSGMGQASMETAQLVGDRLGIAPQKHSGLNNINLGLWQGLLAVELKQRHPRVYRKWKNNPDAVASPEGESLPEVAQRLGQLLAVINKKHPDDVVLLVASRLVAGTLLCVAGGRPLGEAWKVTDQEQRLYPLTLGRMAVAVIE